MSSFTVIAHRGASGYLPEHTLAGAAMAHAMGAGYIEQDAVLTSDNELIVLHDLFLDAVTDVAIRFPGRQRPDGRHYAIDFTLAEIRTLRVHERVDPEGLPFISGRFPPDQGLFRVPTLDEMIRLILGLNQSTGRTVGIYVEPKAPRFHHAEGKDVMAEVLRALASKGYRHHDDRAYLQSFDRAELERARVELRTELQLVQLIGENSWDESATDFDYLRTGGGLAEIAGFAQGIGPWLPQVVTLDDHGEVKPSGLVEAAHAQGLFVHAYTLRADGLTPPFRDLHESLRFLIQEVGLDGVFTDHPDHVRHWVARS